MSEPVIIHSTSQLAAVLYARRLNRGLTLTEVAALVGCQFQAVSMWLRGNQAPRADNLIRLADALGYDLALIPREGTP